MSSQLPYQFEVEQIEKAFQRYYKNYRNKLDDEDTATKTVLRLLIEESLKIPIKMEEHQMKKKNAPDYIELPVLEGVI